MSEIEKFVEFIGGIWEKKERTPNITWIDEVKRLLGEVTIINELEIDTEMLTREINKRKNWTVLGIDGVHNFWKKKLVAAEEALLSALKRIISDNSMTPGWWPTGRTVLLAKTKDLSDEKNYRQITCLNTSYKILTGLIPKYIHEHIGEQNLGRRSTWIARRSIGNS